MNSNVVAVVFQGDFLLWKKKTGGFEALTPDSPDDHVYRFGPINEMRSLDSGSELWLKGVAPGEASLDGKRMFLLKGGEVTDSARAKARTVIHLPQPKQVLHLNKVQLRERGVSWAKYVPTAGDFYELPGYTGSMVSRPGGVFKTIVFVYDTYIGSQMWLEDGDGRTLTTPSLETLGFVATGLDESEDHSIQAGNETAALASFPPIFGLPAPNLNPDTDHTLPGFPADVPGGIPNLNTLHIEDPSGQLKFTRDFELLARHERAGLLGAIPVALKDRIVAKARLLAGGKVLDALGTDDVVKILTKAFIPGGIAGADSGTCAPLGGEEGGGGG